MLGSLNPKHNRKCSQLEMFVNCVFYYDIKHGEMEHEAGLIEEI